MPRISLFKVNVALWALIVVLVVVFFGQLRWAQHEFPRYLRGKVGSPIERKMYRDARDLIRDGRDLDQARELLQRSLAIDPTCAAGYWMARYHAAVGDDEAALAQFERYLKIDPMSPSTWGGAVMAATRLGRRAEARRLAEQGAEYFDSLARASAPRPNRRVSEKFDEKARVIFNRYRDAATALRERAEQLAREPDDGTDDAAVDDDGTEPGDTAP